VAKVKQTAPAQAKQAETQYKVVADLMKELEDLSAKGQIADNKEAAKDQDDRDKRFIQKSRELDEALTAMADILVKAKAFDDEEVAESAIQYDDSSPDQPRAVTATVTSNRERGSAPDSGGDSPKGWQYLLVTDQVHMRGEPNFVKMHLVNENLGGKGKPGNLVPGSGRNNGEMERWFEKPMKYLVGTEAGAKLRGAVKIQLFVRYGRSDEPVLTDQGKKLKVNMKDYPSQLEGTFKYTLKPYLKSKVPADSDFVIGGTLALPLEEPRRI
jgi:hypothetical protein